MSDYKDRMNGQTGGLTLPLPILLRLERYEQYSMKLKKKYTQHQY